MITSHPTRVRRTSPSRANATSPVLAVALAAIAAGAPGARAQTFDYRNGTKLSDTTPAPGATYDGQSIPYANLAGVNLTSATFVTSNLSFSLLSSSNLTAANLTRANLAAANLNSANLFGASLATASLVNTSLRQANLTSANLTSSNLTGVDFTSADLTLADLRQSNYSPSSTTGAALRGTLMPDNTLAATTLSGGETLLLRANPYSLSVNGTISGPSSGTATLLGDYGLWGTSQVGVYVYFRQPASTTVSVRTLDDVALNIRGTAMAQSLFTQPIPTANASGRIAQPLVTVASSLTLANNARPLGSRIYYGLFELGTNDAVIRNGSLADLTDMLRDYTASGGVRGLGTYSTLPNTRLAIMPNNAGIPGVPRYATFDGVACGPADVLIKFTYIGDADLNGVVDANDLAITLAGLNGKLTGWQNGDFNYDGKVSTSDLNALLYTLAARPGSLGDSTSPNGGTGGAIPEPTALAVLLGLTPSLSRRPRRQVVSRPASGVFHAPA